MATTYHTEIQKLYVAYFNRPADFGGLNFWEGVVEAAGGSTAAVSAAFAASAEYQAEYAGMSTADIINQIYINLFGRAAEPTGLAFWANAVANGAVTIDSAVTTIAAGAQGTDKVAFDSKVTFASAFTAALDTPAEQAGYSGDLANAAAKEIVADIKTAADLAAAIVPATLNASVAAVVDAATPFTLVSGLAALDAANEAKADFLAAADGDDDEDTSIAEAAIAVNAGVAEVAIDAFVPGYSAATTAVAAAMLSDEIDARAEALEAAQAVYEAALEEAAEVDGLTDAIAQLGAAEAALELLVEAQTDAEATLAAAEAAYEVKNGAVAITVTATGEVAGIIELDDGELVLATGVDEEDNPGVTALLAASIAKEAADAAVAAGATAVANAELTVDVLDAGAGTAQLALVGGGMTVVDPEDAAAPTADEILTEIAGLEAIAAATAAIAAEPDATAAEITAASDAATALSDFQGLVDDFVAADGNPLVDDVDAAAGDPVAGTGVVGAEADVEDLNEAIAELDAANALVAELAEVNAAITAAKAEFTEAGLKTPVDLLAVSTATAGSDIFVVGDIAASTVVNFGQLGTDSLFIGSDYTLNTGALSTGNNSVLEVFMIQSGTSVKVYLETEVYGSDSAAVAEQVITLTGITVAELTLANGIITAA